MAQKQIQVNETVNYKNRQYEVTEIEDGYATLTDDDGRTEYKRVVDSPKEIKQKLKTSISNGTAVSETFEAAIAEHGLTDEIIGLIKSYYSEVKQK